ncbi:Sensor histidine kinase ResE [Candidatus Thermoflexus japonica]|uniref:histidine kinase n=1 Tax=Candidatus Thermoflexus japonica TaxID=2035417 RepID=A0A2H5Y438_9CHLR|nr:Sensor histidine kinase ResE [Candidatus Thermoflexus japonica]
MAFLGGILGLAGLILVAGGVRRVRALETRLWALALLGLVLWTWGESLIIAVPDPGWRLLGFRMQALGVAIIAPFFLLGVIRYSGALPRLRPGHWIGVLLIPLLTILLAFSNDRHHLVWSTLAVHPDGSLDVSYGPWFWIHTLFALLAFLSALVLLLPTLIYAYRSAFPVFAGFLVAIALIAAAVILTVYDPSYDELPAWWRGMTAGMLGMAAVVLGLIFQDLPRLRPIPIARGLLIEHMSEGMMVLDPRGWVIDLNPRMAELLGRPAAACLGAPVETLLEGWPELREALQAAIQEGRERSVELRHPSHERWFLFSIQPVPPHGERAGWLVRSSEITEHRQHALRHARQQAALLHIARDPQIQSGDVDEAMARIAWIAAETLQVSRVNIWRLDAVSGQLICLVHVEWPDGRMGKEPALQVADFPAYFRALQEGRAIDASDAWEDPRTSELRERYMAPRGIRAMLDAPIRRGDQVIGVICHEQVGQARIWTADEIAFAAGVADLVALIWANAERRAAEARAQRYAGQLQLLQQLTQELFQTVDLDRFYDRVLQGILEILRADRAAILLRDPDGVVRFKAWRNLSEEYRQAVEGHWPWDPSDPDPQILWIPDVEQARELGEVREAVLREGIRALAFVPIRSGGQALGKLMLYYDRPQAPDEETMHLARALADVVAVALRRRREAWLWEAMAGALQEVLGSPPEFRQRVQTILQAVRRLLRADRAGVWFYEPIREQVACAGVEGLSEAYVRWLLESYQRVPGVRAIEIPTVIYISDVQRDPRTEGVRDRLVQEGFRAYVVFPLWAPAMTPDQFPFRGVLTVYWDTVWTLEAEELLVGQAFANAAAQALANAYLFEETRRRARHEAALNQVVAAILRAEDLDGVLRIGLEQAGAIMGFRMGMVHLWDEGQNCLRLRAAIGIPEDVRGLLERCHPEEGIAGLFLDQPVVYSDLPREAPEIHRSIPPLPARAWVSVPLRTGSRRVGVLSLLDPAPHLFTADELALIQTLADHLALAVERAMLVERMAEQIREVSLLYEASANLLAAHEVGSVVRLLGRFLSEITGSIYARFYRYRPEADALELLSEYIAPDAASEKWLSWIDQVREASLSIRSAALHERRPYALWIPEPGRFEGTPVPLMIRQEDEQTLERLGVRRLMVLPLALGARVLGLAEVWDPRSDHGFSLNQIALSQAIVNHAAVALENVRLLELLEEERSHLRTLIHAAVDGIVLIGADGRILELNPAALDLLDLQQGPGAWIGRPLADGIRGLRKRRPALARALMRQLRKWRRDPSEAWTMELDTETRSLRLQIVPIQGDGTVMGWLAMIYDMTPLRTLERLREELFHMVVHDLRNPAASVQTALDFLLGEGLGPLSQEQREVLTIARDNIGRMLRMVSTILELRRLQSGEGILHRKAISLPELVAGILRELSILIREKSLEMRVDIPDALPPVWGDELLIIRVFQNLLDNAIKFTPSGGEIWIRAAPEQRDGRPWVKVMVTDSGPGVPPEMREEIFKPFVTGMTKGRGVGLGLAFCKLAVEAHGGRIWVEDRPGGGAAFVFTLPVAPEE